MTAMMKAARLHQTGHPFQIDEIPIPEPTGIDVLVRVRACAIAPNLRNVVTHYPEWMPTLPLPKTPAIYGLDAAGEIAAIGPDVIGLDVGQRVYVDPLRHCGTCLKCRSGKQLDCTSLTFSGYFGASAGAQKLIDRYPWGGLAQYLIAPGSRMITLPDNLSLETASRFGYLCTSFGALRKVNASYDTSVLINGATGTVGIGAVLTCLGMGIPKILAVARNESILAELKKLAPNRIHTYSTNNGPCTEWARSMTGGSGADIVLETLSPHAPAQATMDAFMATARCGKIVTVGGAMETLPIDPQWIMTNNISYIGSGWFSTADAQIMAGMVGAGVVDLSLLENRCFPLEKVNDALDYACNRSNGGLETVVVTP